MRNLINCEAWDLPLTRHQGHSLAMRAAGREAIICIARHPMTAHTFSYEVCVLLCEKCRRYTKTVKDRGYLPVKVQRIRRGAEAATPSASERLP